MGPRLYFRKDYSSFVYSALATIRAERTTILLAVRRYACLSHVHPGNMRSELTAGRTHHDKEEQVQRAPYLGKHHSIFKNFV